jgi:hypothetical protein
MISITNYVIIGQRTMTCHEIRVKDIQQAVVLKNGNLAVMVLIT